MNLVAAVFFVVLGLSLMAWALFLALDWPGLLLLIGAVVTAVGLIGVPVDRGDR